MNNKFLVKNILFIAAIAALFLGLAGSASGILPVSASQNSQSVPEASYKTIEFLDPEGITFELPEEWEIWGNGGYYSPDGGKTAAGVRMAFNNAGMELEPQLFNGGTPVTKQASVTIGEIQAQRYVVESVLTDAITGEEISHTFEMIYACPSPDGAVTAGVFVSAQAQEDLEALVPVAEHMAESLRWVGQ